MAGDTLTEVRVREPLLDATGRSIAQTLRASDGWTLALTERGVSASKDGRDYLIPSSNVAYAVLPVSAPVPVPALYQAPKFDPRKKR